MKRDFFESGDWSGVGFEEFREALGGYIEWYRSGKPEKSLGWKILRRRRGARIYAA